MARITLEQIQEAAATVQWTVVSDTYQNLNTEMHFKCSEGHDVYATWKALRDKFECPISRRNERFETKEVKAKPTNTTRTLALDQASHVTGYAVFDNTTLVSTGTFTAKGRDEVDRILEIKYWLISMIDAWRPDHIGLEGIQFQEDGGGKAMGVTVFETLAHLQGVLMALCRENEIKCTVCPTNTWRHACNVKGRTRADKKRSMQLKIKEWYGISVTDDIADAIGIGYYLSHQIENRTKVVNWEEEE